ncbi:type VI secretion protein IcmF/TssM N-terminal domain-containing protein [Lignipirellula cremea]|uniref:Type VI secretion system component TssM1 N-terminal domain-containing protein n=1 Tax=Lignipirellula cremea TaxID=2528010 RepID=A0A518DPT5_9BACT|nr:type VI secretion protein IcmF/TssM N-terminal domain-containing protein [Lignipirellula cremea]QDU93849.1 hypothetical protein Pla8534_16330 [Lignipirellula cremea]
MGLLRSIGSALLWMFQWAALPMTKLRGASGAGKWLRWVAHIVLVAAILVGLGYLNYILELEKVLRTPLPLLRQVWLPLLFAMIYGLALWAWRLWKTASASGDPSPFPEIDRVWAAAVESLERSGVDLQQAPLYLMFGRPQETSQRLYHSAHLPLVVPPTPSEAGVPFRVSAARDAVYVNCEDISTLSLWCAALERQRAPRRGVERTLAASDGSDDGDFGSVESGALDLEQISSPGGTALAVAPALKTSSKAPGSATLDVLEQQLAQLAEAEASPATGPSARRKAVLQPAVAPAAPPLQTAEVEQCLLQLRRLCELIMEARGPFSPLNGIVLLLPFSASDNESDANHAGALLQRDLQTVNEVLQVTAPITAVICDLQQARGCRELLERFPEEQRQRRFGLRFPKLAACDSPNLPRLLEQGAAWICDRLAPPLVYRLFRTGVDSAGDNYEVRGNVELYRFLCELRERRPRLERILQRGLTVDSGRLGYFSGCYLAATGLDAVREQGFAAALFPQLEELQNRLNWTPEAIHRDRVYRRWTILGYTAIASVTAGVIAIGVWL